MDSLVFDCRQAINTLAKNKVIIATSATMLAIGIGLNASVFVVVTSVLFAPPVARLPQELRYISATTTEGRSTNGVSYRDYLEFRSQSTGFAEVLLRGIDIAFVGSGGTDDEEQTTGEMVSANYFDVLGVPAAIGNTFTTNAEALSRVEDVVVISDRLWRSRFATSLRTIGEQMTLDGRKHTVIGVMPPTFHGTLQPWEHASYWVPLGQRINHYECQKINLLNAGLFLAIGRIDARYTDTQRQLMVATVGRQLQSLYRPDRPDWSLSATTTRPGTIALGDSGILSPNRLTLALFFVSGMVLLIGATNLSGVLMAQGFRRRLEFAIRFSLGAPGWRTARQLLLEAIGLGALATVMAVLFARLFLVMFLSFASNDAQDVVISAGLANASSIIFAAALALATAIFVGLVPILERRDDAMQLLVGEVATVPRSTTHRFRYFLVIPQIAASYTLLLCGGMFGEALVRANWVDIGYRSKGMTFVGIDLPPPNPCRRSSEINSAFANERREFNRRLIELSQTVSTFRAVALTSELPFERSVALIAPMSDESLRTHKVSRTDVSPEYFDTMGIPVLNGRRFSEHDSFRSPAVAIISESLARQVWPDRNAIGEYFGFVDPSAATVSKWTAVVGVVGDIRLPFAEDLSPSRVYIPLLQGTYGRFLLGYGYQGHEDATKALKQLVGDSSDKVRIVRTGTISRELSEILFARRAAAVIFLAAGAFGLLLASTGLYGIASYATAQRNREMAVRLALGAKHGEVVRLLVKDGALVLAIGLTLGLAISLVMVRIASSMFWPFPTLHPATVVVVTVVLATVIMISCYLPARKAATTSLLVALRTN